MSRATEVQPPIWQTISGPKWSPPISLASFPGFRSDIWAERYVGTRLWESSYGVDFNYRTLRWGGSVSSPVCVVAVCHSLPLPTAQEICPHPLTEDAEVGRTYIKGKVLSRDCGIAIDPRAYWPGLGCALLPPLLIVTINKSTRR